MKTHLTTSPEEAAEYIKWGGIVAFPTETVYGLGAAAFDERAISKIFEAKRRPADNPLIAHIAYAGQERELASEIGGYAHRLMEAFFPGPLTVVLKKQPSVPLIATAGLQTIGVRMPRLPLANEFLTACQTPVVAPSANLSGRPSPTTWQAVAEDLDGRIDCILQGGESDIGLESTVVDCTTDPPVVLRAGSISSEQIEELFVVGQLVYPQTSESARSPGMRHKHYSPRAIVELVDLKSEISNLKFEGSAYIGLTDPGKHFERKKICDSTEQYAHDLFEFFRECDRSGIERIYCQVVAEEGIGVALMDRIRRAAS